MKNENEDFEEKYPHMKKFHRFLPEFNKESDRGMVLISVSYLDQLMAEILKSYFIEGKVSAALVDGFNAPLGSFSARTAAAYSLGLISKPEFSEANLLRKVRNCFAHDIHVTFDDSSIIDLCKKLTYSAKDYGTVIVSPRGLFSSSAVCLILNLTNRAFYVSEERRQFGNWRF